MAGAKDRTGGGGRIFWKVQPRLLTIVPPIPTSALVDKAGQQAATRNGEDDTVSVVRPQSSLNF